MTLHWALKSRQEDALLQGQAYSSILPYLPLLVSDEGDEACELALSPEEVGSATWCPNPDYLSAEDRLMALKMIQKGETVLKVANVLDKAYQSVCRYVGAYIRPNLKLFVSESGRADEGEERRNNELVAEVEEVEKEVDEPHPPRDIYGPPEPVPGAPDPDWLSADERRLLREMRRRGESKRAIAEALGKGYVRLIKYINADQKIPSLRYTMKPDGTRSGLADRRSSPSLTLSPDLSTSLNPGDTRSGFADRKPSTSLTLSPNLSTSLSLGDT
ncbi:hypothetical protein VPNG_08382 [Cytospora leucostoma]|uniref:Uncharacterized protein n=1 Tax=Cytospora leucostoma TaxID=1230097 RepID=A0A423W6F4_9PEZI|nr:hypothetical protein VPNG_08382 [Cytospora leucostoma]